MERTLPEDHADRIAGKAFDSSSHYNFAHKFFTMPQAMKILDAKAAVDKEWEKLEKMPTWSKSEAIKETHKEQSTVHLLR